MNLNLQIADPHVVRDNFYKIQKEFEENSGGGPDHFLGLYTNLPALEATHPTATPGDYAQVDAGPGTDVMNYIWDEDDGWVAGGSGGIIPAATETVAGIAEIATTAEVTDGIDDDKIVTPLKLKEVTEEILAQLDVENTGNYLFNYYNFY